MNVGSLVLAHSPCGRVPGLPINAAVLRLVVRQIMRRLSLAEVAMVALSADAPAPSLALERLQALWVVRPEPEPVLPLPEPAPQRLCKPAAWRNRIKNLFLTTHKDELKARSAVSMRPWRTIGCLRFALMVEGAPSTTT